MNKFVIILFFASCLLATATDAVWGEDVSLNSPPVANADKVVETKGKPFVLYWGSFKCPRCTAQKKDFARLAKAADKRGFLVMGVQSEPMSKEAIIEAVKDSRFEFPFYSPLSLRYSNSKEGKAVKAPRIPAYLVFDAEGKHLETFSDAKSAKRLLYKISKK